MPETQVQEIQKSIGETLAEVRKQRNLSVQEAANQLRLDAKIIEALETENYDILPSPAYTRGYLRSYAKLLSLDADRIISQYNHKAPQPPEIIPDVRHPTQVSSSDKPIKVITYLVTFILLLLVLAWVQSNFVVREPPPNSAPGALAPAPEPRISLPQQPEPESQAAQDTAGEVEEEPGVQQEPAASVPAEEEAAQLQAAPETTTVEPPGSTQGVPEQQQASDQPVSPVPEADESPGKTQVADGSTGPDSITMKLSADSWIEIYDAFNNRLLMTLARSGDEINLKGTAPFHVKLGFSQGVTLTFNGVYFDPAPYSHGGVATFTLGE
jgi:cytoskeleton protein RodZ